MPDRYLIKQHYAAREQPRYFADVDSGVTFQPDVYDTAAAVARGLGARRIVDVGTGQGRKLASLHPQLEVVGIDFGSNLEHARRTYPFGTWIEADLDQPGPLPLDPEQLQGAVVVCADVIEHVQDPALLLDKLKGTLAAAAPCSCRPPSATWCAAASTAGRRATRVTCGSGRSASSTRSCATGASSTAPSA